MVAYLVCNASIFNKNILCDIWNWFKWFIFESQTNLLQTILSAHSTLLSESIKYETSLDEYHYKHFTIFLFFFLKRWNKIILLLFNSNDSSYIIFFNIYEIDCFIFKCYLYQFICLHVCVFSFNWIFFFQSIFFLISFCVFFSPSLCLTFNVNTL